jgi:hypothetical protein
MPLVNHLPRFTSCDVQQRLWIVKNVLVDNQDEFGLKRRYAAKQKERQALESSFESCSEFQVQGSN